MKPATELHPGAVIKQGDDLFRVTSSEYHAGGGKMPGVVHAKLRNLRTSHLTERRFRPEERIEEVTLDRVGMEFLYEDGAYCTFMNPETYEQVALPKEKLEPFRRFLKPNDSVQVEFLNGAAIEVITPQTVTLRVRTAPEPMRAQHDSNVYKTVTLDNGMEVLVPQFIKVGDLVKIEVESGKYMERVK